MKTPLVVIAVVAAFAVPAAADNTDSCPSGARYATNGTNFASCLFENMTLPQGVAVHPYCDYLDQGYIGFYYATVPINASYVCPAGSYHSSNGAGTDFCVFNVDAPTWAQSYCDYLTSGYIGYSWLICPPGARLSSNGAGTEFC